MSQEQYNKTYNSSSEEVKRFNIFLKNYQLINDHNKKFANNKTTFLLGVNEFADKSLSDFNSLKTQNQQTKNLVLSDLLQNLFSSNYPTGINRHTDYIIKDPVEPVEYRKDASFPLIPRKSEPELKKTLENDGPVAVGIDASQTSFLLYANGVYDTWTCNKVAINHVVIIVGYGSMMIGGREVPYWKVENSWGKFNKSFLISIDKRQLSKGKKWGINGYFYLKRGVNSCGVPTFASLSTVNDTSDITVAPPSMEVVLPTFAPPSTVTKNTNSSTIVY